MKPTIKETLIKDKPLECATCGYKGKNWKELKLTGDIGSFRARCPKCKKVDTFLELRSKRSNKSN